MQTLSRRRDSVIAALGNLPASVLCCAGRDIAIPGSPTESYPFQVHPIYYWLTGHRRPGGVLALDRRHGTWRHFAPTIGTDERLWDADSPPPDADDLGHLQDWLCSQSENRIVVLGGEVDGIDGDRELSALIAAKIDCVRRKKDVGDLELVNRACSATMAGFERAREVIAPGVTEREIRIEVEAEMFRCGADGVGFPTIVGAGLRAAVLHARPGNSKVAKDDVVLVDVGAEIAGYTADVTRTIPAGERFTPEQQAVHDIVLSAQRAAIKRCRCQVEWHEVHRAAAAELAGGLRDLGLMRASVSESLDSGAIAVFFPHGIGHMVGLGVRDVGGRLPGRDESRHYCGAKIRVDMPLEDGFLMTVEPGIYFAAPILDDFRIRERFQHSIDWQAVDRWRHVGGVRIEDDVLVTSCDPEILTEGILK